MLLAKHGYAHARLDKQLRQKRYSETLLRLGPRFSLIPSQHCLIGSAMHEPIITRKVAKGGKYAHTSYQVVQSLVIFI